MTARRLGIPSATTFDYEFAWLQHQLGCRAATRSSCQTSIPPERLARYGARPAASCLTYAGLKEETTSPTSSPIPASLDAWASTGAHARRPAPAAGRVALPPSLEPALPADARLLGSDPGRQAVVLPRTEEQRDYVRSLALPSVIVPDRAVDAQSLIALADLVVSAGGTMNREAAALGVPVYTTYGGRLGGVDEELIREGRLRPLTDPRALGSSSATRDRARIRRDPGHARSCRPIRPGRRTASTSSPYRSSFAGPIPGHRRAPSVAGLRPAIAARVALWKTTYAGRRPLSPLLPPGFSARRDGSSTRPVASAGPCVWTPSSRRNGLGSRTR